MQGHVRRRAFLGSAAVVGAGSAIAFQLAPFQKEVSAQTPELVDKELRRQLRAGVLALRGTRRGEAARMLASTLRIGAAVYASNGVDAALKTKLRAAIRRDGRQTLALRELDPRMFAEEMKQYGFVTPPPLRAVDYTVREQAIDRLAAGGLAQQMLTVAELFERMAEDFDERSTALVSFRRAGANCPDLLLQLVFVEMMMIAACLVNPITCAIFAGMYSGLILGLAIYGC